jgi:hypothetical protein
VHGPVGRDGGGELTPVGAFGGTYMTSMEPVGAGGEERPVTYVRGTSVERVGESSMGVTWTAAS